MLSRFGPLPKGPEYKVLASKQGYVIENDKANAYDFNVYKLAEVAVQVTNSIRRFHTGLINIHHYA